MSWSHSPPLPSRLLRCPRWRPRRRELLTRCPSWDCPPRSFRWTGPQRRRCPRCRWPWCQPASWPCSPLLPCHLLRCPTWPLPRCRGWRCPNWGCPPRNCHWAGSRYCRPRCRWRWCRRASWSHLLPIPCHPSRCPTWRLLRSRCWRCPNWDYPSRSFRWAGPQRCRLQSRHSWYR